MRIDDDDDDDDLVLFKEQQVPLNHFSLSQSSVHNSQSQEASPIKARTNCIISRQERRKRRHEWRERQLVEQELSPEEATPESEDAFASLQSLLEPSQDIPQPSQPQEAEKENIRQDTEMNDCDMDPKTAEEETQRKEKEIGKVDDQILQVTSNKHIQTVLVQDQRMTYQNNEETETIDFDTFRDDHDDDDDDDEILPPSQQRKSPEPAKSRFPSRGFDARNESCSPTRRSKKPRHNLDKLRQMIQGKSSQNRPLSSKQQTSRRPFPFQEPEADTGRLSNPWNRKTQSQIQAIETQNAKSIVGSRPNHWNRDKERSMPFLQSQRRQRFIQKRDLSSVPLSTPRMALQPTTGSRTKDSDTTTRLKNKYFPQRNSTSRAAVSKSKSPDKSRGRSNSPVSFAPSFMPTTKRVNATDQVEDTQEKEPLTASIDPPTTHHQFPSPPPQGRRRRGRKTSGTLGKKLEALQSARSNDALRLQNQAFLRHNTFDMNDPRKRAKSQTDVTIVGDCARPYGAAEDSKFTVLTYVHSHRQKDRPESAAALEHELAWATFTFATARNINLQKGKQVRLYNAIFIPCQQHATMDGLAIETLKSNVCERILIATWLCETHPGGLLDLSFTTNTEETNNEMQVDT